jgi:hypothetical protein
MQAFTHEKGKRQKKGPDPIDPDPDPDSDPDSDSDSDSDVYQNHMKKAARLARCESDRLKLSLTKPSSIPRKLRA